MAAQTAGRSAVLQRIGNRSFCRGYGGKFNTPNLVVIVPAVGGIFFPLAGRLGRSPRENVTPKVLEKIVWAGANLGSYPQATAALKELAEVDLAGKQVQRVTSQIGGDSRRERAANVAAFRVKPLAERTAGSPTAKPPTLGVVMMDGGRWAASTPRSLRPTAHVRPQGTLEGR